MYIYEPQSDYEKYGKNHDIYGTYSLAMGVLPLMYSGLIPRPGRLCGLRLLLVVFFLQEIFPR